MKLSEQKQFTKDVDCGVLTLYHTLVAYRDSFNYSDNFCNVLNSFIDFCEDLIYPILPGEKQKRS